MIIKKYGVILSLLFAAQGAFVVAQQSSKLPLFIGTYTDKGSEGIYRSYFDAKTGQLTEPKLVAKVGNPSFIAISSNNHFLWSISEMDSTYGITAFSITGNDSLHLINRQTGIGGLSCHIAELEPMKWLGTASYGNGLVTLYPLSADGSVGNIASVDHHWGKTPRAHCILPDPKGKFIYSADLGIDKILIYTIDNHSLKPFGEIDLSKGVGPRHFAFSPNGEWMAVINELKSRIIVIGRDTSGAFGIVKENISSLPQNFHGKNAAAEIQFSPDGRFLYASNRGDNSIVTCTFDEQTGRVRPIQWVRNDIQWPRNFTIDPTGNFLLVANQNGNGIVMFKRNRTTGLLSPTHQMMKLSEPVCLMFLHYKYK
ncbi:MAG: lactonase family protein [Microbacter sp.]